LASDAQIPEKKQKKSVGGKKIKTLLRNTTAPLMTVKWIRSQEILKNDYRNDKDRN
jgi:hypothetical protein